MAYDVFRRKKTPRNWAIMRCGDMSDLRGVMLGWGCCGCNTYNGEHREKCKYCSHQRCDIRKARPSVVAFKVAPEGLEPSSQA